VAKDKSNFTNFDTPYQVQPPGGSAEPDIDYGGVAEVASKGDARDPMGVMPPNAKQHNIGPRGGEG
jgi:hypothetical protein